MYLQHFWSSGKFFVFLSTKLRQACQKLIVHVQTNILGRNHFVWKEHKFFILSGIRAKTFQSFDDKFFTGWSQMDSTCAEAQFEEKEFSFQKIHNISLPFLESQWQICGFLVFWRTIFRRVVKIAFSVVRESFLMKIIFDKKNCNSILFGLWETLSSFWRQIYGSLVEISLYMFRRTFWGEIGFLESFFFIISGVRAKSFQSFDKKFLAGLSQLHSTCT